MRLYTLNHFMLSQIQIGIQSGHATVELFTKYKQNEMLYDWAENYKTHIVLNAGNSIDLENVRMFFMSSDNTYPWAFFNEDESLGNLLTSVSIILPEKIYETATFIRQKRIEYNEYSKTYIPQEWDLEASEHCLKYNNFSFYESELINYINNFRLV